MVNKVTSIIKEKDLIVPNFLFYNYKKLNISELELILLVYFINLDSLVFNMAKISKDLNITNKDVLKLIDSLTSNGLIKIEVKKIQDKMIEYINLDALYDKISFLVIGSKEEESSSLFDTFEKEMGRTLSPIEYEIIGGFKEAYSDTLILLALKEAIYNGVTNLRYIDKILFEWNKKGIKNENDLNNIQRKSRDKKENIKLFDYDWLNEKD